MFNVNDKVVCVDDSPSPIEAEFFFPLGKVNKNTVYVVEGLTRSGGVRVVGKPIIWLPGDLTTAHHPSRFRLLSDIQAENRKLAEMRALNRLLNDVMGEPNV